MTTNQAEYLEALTAAHEDRTKLGLFIDGVIAAGRTAGLTWKAMGGAMGMDGNAVRQRMKRRARLEAQEVQ